MKIIIFAICIIIFNGIVSANAISPGTYYVIAETLNVRTDANAKADIAKKLLKNAKVEVIEIKNGWARVTKYIETDNAKKIALWVSAKYLSRKSINIKICKVLNVDTSMSYLGGCKNGLAHGEGVAKGRDVYRGAFSNGNNHGFGIYEWGSKSKWGGDRYEGEWNNGHRTGYGEYSSNNTLAHSKLENGRHVQRGMFNDRVFTQVCNSKTDCKPINKVESISKNQIKKLMGSTILQAFKLDDSDIPTEVKDEIGQCLSDIFLGSILDDGKSTYTKSDLDSLLNELKSKMPINMLALSLDEDGFFKQVEGCAKNAQEKGFKYVSFNSLVLSMDDYKYENIKVSGNGLFLMNQFVLRKDAVSTNMIMVNIESLDKKNKTEILDKCSNPMQGCQVMIYGRVERDDYESIFEARVIKWQQ